MEAHPNDPDSDYLSGEDGVAQSPALPEPVFSNQMNFNLNRARGFPPPLSSLNKLPVLEASYQGLPSSRDNENKA
jgi:hypothetical protein